MFIPSRHSHKFWNERTKRYERVTWWEFRGKTYMRSFEPLDDYWPVQWYR